MKERDESADEYFHGDVTNTEVPYLNIHVFFSEHHLFSSLSSAFKIWGMNQSLPSVHINKTQTLYEPLVIFNLDPAQRED